MPHRETLAIMAVRGAGLLAAKTPGVWVDVPSPGSCRRPVICAPYAAKAAGIRGVFCRLPAPENHRAVSSINSRPSA